MKALCYRNRDKLWLEQKAHQSLPPNRCHYEMVLIYQPLNAHVRISGILLCIAMAAAAVKKIYAYSYFVSLWALRSNWTVYKWQLRSRQDLVGESEHHSKSTGLNSASVNHKSIDKNEKKIFDICYTNWDILFENIIPYGRLRVTITTDLFPNEWLMQKWISKVNRNIHAMKFARNWKCLLKWVY
jgi:hypothetical protein